MPPLMHVGAPPSVHPVSGSLLPWSACLLGCWANAAVLVALRVERKEAHPTQVRPTCILHPSCPSHNLPLHPDYMSSLSCQLLSSLSLSSRLLSLFRPRHPCLSTWGTPPQRSLCPARPRWAASRAQSIHCQPALHLVGNLPCSIPLSADTLVLVNDWHLALVLEAENMVRTTDGLISSACQEYGTEHHI